MSGFLDDDRRTRQAGGYAPVTAEIALDETPYQRLRRQRGASMTVATAKARQAERTRRNTEARRRAWATLATRYPDEFAELLRLERAGLDAERGPLPGDEDGDHR